MYKSKKQDLENLIFNCNEQALKDNALENLEELVYILYSWITLFIFFVLSNVKNENNFIKKYFIFIYL